MESSSTSEPLSEWEEIPYPCHHQLAPPAQRQHLDPELVAGKDNHHNGRSVFPPSEHEDLAVEDGVCPEDSECIRSLSPLPSPLSEEHLAEKRQRNSESKLSVIISEIKSNFQTLCRKACSLYYSSISRHCSSFVPLTTVALVILACVRIVQWRKQLLFLIGEKDQRISQLLDQIAHMNEILSARRRVPVMRI